MKKIMTFAILAAVLSMGLIAAEGKTPATGQTLAAMPDVTPEMVRYALNNERRIIFEAAMSGLLKDPTAKGAFWGVFDAYEMEKSKVADQKMALITDYAANFGMMSEAQLKDLMKRSYNIQTKELKIRKKFGGQLAKKTNATIAGRFWQVDDFISSVVKVGLLANVPLLGEDIR